MSHSIIKTQSLLKNCVPNSAEELPRQPEKLRLTVESATEQVQQNASRAKPLSQVQPYPTQSTASKAWACFAKFFSSSPKSENTTPGRFSRMLSCLGRAMSNIRKSFSSSKAEPSAKALTSHKEIIAAQLGRRLDSLADQQRQRVVDRLKNDKAQIKNDREQNEIPPRKWSWLDTLRAPRKLDQEI